MKRKLFITVLSFVFAFAGIFGITTAFAEGNTEMTVQDVNFTNYAGWAGDCIAVNFGVPMGADWTNLTATHKDYVELVNKDGEAYDIKLLDVQNTYFIVNRAQGYTAAQGDVLTLKKGLTINGYELKETVAYEYSAVGAPWTEKAIQVVEKDPLVIQEINYADPWYGISIMVNFGTTTPAKADWAQIETDKIILKDADGNVQTVAAETQGTYVLVNRNSSVVPADGWTITFLKNFEIIYKTPVNGVTSTGEKIAEDITYVCHANAPWTVFDPSSVKTEVELTVNQVNGADNVNYSMDWGKGENFGTVILVRFDTENWGGNLGLYAGILSGNEQYITLTDAFGDNVAISDITYVNEGHFLVRSTAAAGALYAGGKLEIKEGFSITIGNTVATLAADHAYLCLGETGHTMPAFSADTVPASVTITNGAEDKDLPVGAELQITYEIPSGTYGTAKFTVSDDTKATVDKFGKVTAVAEGTVTVTAAIGDASDAFEINVMPALDVTGVELVNAYTYYVIKGEQAVLPELYARAVFEGGAKGTAFALVNGENAAIPAVDTSVEGVQNITISIEYRGENYEVEYEINVYTPYDLVIKELGIVDWFAFSLFIQYPNSSANVANITAVNNVHSVVDHITYARADGTVLPTPGYYVLGGGNIALFYFSELSGEPQTSELYKQYYLEGDIITLEAGLCGWRWTGKLKATETDNAAIDEGTGMYIIEAVLKETVQYRYSNNTWGLYVEYEDIAAKSETIDVTIGENVYTGIDRIPANATTGTMTYTSSDTNVATVSASGVITGVGEGTATITATISGGTAGEKTVTVTVNVSDTVVGIEFDDKELSFNVGDQFDVTSLKARLVYASGKKSELIDLTGATVTGLDLTRANNDIMVVSVTIDGETYTGSVAVSVTEEVKKGCFGAMGTGSLFALAALGVASMIKRSKKQ
ncbi:MAG: Ig-like domain-containing protein [Clostridia bacterium]|nr:Ig-like domain-containing protein [Clostridia bacterium]